MPPPPVIVANAKEYPLPAEVTVIEDTAEPVRAAVAVAPVPSPVMITVGLDEYALPPVKTAILSISPLTSNNGIPVNFLTGI